MRKVIVFVLLATVLFCLSTGCKKDKDKPIPASGADWAIWSDPAKPDALSVSDPSGDGLIGFGAGESDWVLLEGTFDNNFAYIGLDLSSPSGIDITGNVEYSLNLFLTGNMTPEPGNYFANYSFTTGWIIMDHEFNVVSNPFKCTTTGPHHIDVAIPRGMCNEPMWLIAAVSGVWVGGSIEPDDFVPDLPNSATFEFNQPLEITTTTLPDGVVGQTYGPQQLTATGGATPYTWSEDGSSLATYGLTLNPDGSITGTPTQAGICNFMAEVMDSSVPAQNAQKALTLTVFEQAFATWGGTGPEYINGVTVDTTGNIYCAGWTYSFGAGGDDALLLKYDSVGTLQWARTWGDADAEWIYSLAADSGGDIYCAGCTYSFGAGNYDALLLRYDSAGTLQWAKTWGGADIDYIYSLAVDSGGNIYCAGWTRSFGAGDCDALLLKYDSSGTLQWANTWGGAGGEQILGVVVDSSGNIYCAGETDSFGAGNGDALLLKYNSSGTLQWAKTWGDTDGASISGITVDTSGNIYCAGWTLSLIATMHDALLLKYDSSGTLQWAKTWGGAGWEQILGVTVDTSGNIYCGGGTYSFGAGNGDALLLKYNSSGTLQWVKTWGGADFDRVCGVAVDSGGNVYWAGPTISYTGLWQTVTTGTQTTPTGTQTTPTGTEGSPAGTEDSPTGTEGSPTGSETGAGGLDTLLLKNWQ